MRSSLLDELGRGLPDDGARQGPARRRGAPPARRAQRAAARRPPGALSLGFVVVGRDHDRDGLLHPRARAAHTEALSIPDYWVLQGTFLIASAAVIFANLVANLLYGVLDPRVRHERPRERPARAARQRAPGRRRRGARGRARTWRVPRAPLGMVGLVVLVVLRPGRDLRAAARRPDGLEVTKATGGSLEPPSREYPLGTDDNGRSVLTLLIWGARISLFVGLFATVISMVLGTLIGMASGFFEGWPARSCSGSPSGSWSSRSCRWRSCWPRVLGGRCSPSSLVIGVTTWPGTALLIRAQTLSIKERPYLERARVLGAGRWHQMTPARAAQRDADGLRQHHADGRRSRS